MSIYQPGLVGETLVGNGQFNVQLTGAQLQAGVVVKGVAGRLATVLVTVVTNAVITIYDNPSTGSGNIVGYIPSGATAGTIYNFNMPCAAGIYVAASSGQTGQITISFV
jgi:hypothetical protein